MSTPDISKLSREEKLALIQVLEEKERRAQLSGNNYKPHPGQLRVHQSVALEKYCFSGNGFGKSALLVNEVHFAAVGYNPFTKLVTPVPAKICLLLDSPEKVDDFITEYRLWNPLLAAQLHKKGKANYSFITYDNGSSITVLSHAVEDLKLEGSQWDFLFCDEPPPQSVYNSIYRGGRRKNHIFRVLLVGTPIKAAWLRTKVFEPWAKGELPNVECFKGDSAENEQNLADGYLERFAAKLSEREREIRLHGAFYDLTGLALNHLFDETVHVVRRDEQECIEIVSAVIAMDPHPSKKSHACLMGVDRDNQLYVVKHMALKLTAREYARELKKFMHGYRVIDIVCDSLGSAQMTGGEGFKSWIEILNEEGLRCRATTYDEKNDEEFISRIQDVLLVPEAPDSFGRRLPKLRIFEQCIEPISNIRNVQWVHDKRQEENKPKLDIGNLDALATIKYALSTNLYAAKGKEKAYYRKTPAYGIDPSDKRQARRRHRIELPEDSGRQNPYLPTRPRVPWARD